MTAWNSSAVASGIGASVTARRYESVATMAQPTLPNVTRTPVRMARLASFETTRETRLTMAANSREGDFNTLMNVDGGESREILVVQSLQGERRGIARDERALVLSLDVNRGVGEVLHNVGEELSRQNGLAVFLDEGGGGILDGQFEIRRLENDLIAGSFDEDTREHGERRARGNTLQDNRDGVLQFAFIDAEFHRAPKGLNGLRMKKGVEASLYRLGSHHLEPSGIFHRRG